MAYGTERISTRALLLACSVLVATVLALTTATAGAAAPKLTIPAGDGGTSGRAATVALPLAEAAEPLAGVAARRGKVRRAAPRRGGVVRPAWPRRAGAKAPGSRLARWLARQVGPIEVRPRPRKRIGNVQTRRRTAVASAAATSRDLLLVRSFDIPETDPQYAALTNYSWTYDNALAVFAFLSVGARGSAEELLDQLRALQRTNGSLDLAYDVKTGAGAGTPRAGAMAWVALAAAAYRREYDNSRYDDLIDGVVTYLLDLRTGDGLIRGGSDVSWVSTQHNLLTIGALRDLADQIKNGQTIAGYRSWELNNIQNAMGNAVLSKLIVQQGPLAYFIAGVNDRAIPVDVQALGAMYLKLRGDGRASQVANYLTQGGFFVGSRKVTGSTRSVSGYRPYADAGSPDVIWAEGTFEAALALDRANISHAATSAAVQQFTATTNNLTQAPIGADRNIENSKWGEFHTWPTSAAASWLLVLSSSKQLLYAQ